MSATAGPNHCNIYLAPKRGVELIWWSVGDGYPQPSMMPRYVKRPHYFIFYSYGTFKQDLQLIIDIEVSYLELIVVVCS